MVIVWDLLLYLALAQLLPIVILCARHNNIETGVVNKLLAWQIICITAFWLVWGGYSTDAWRYLSRFDKNAEGFKLELVFWSFGHLLGKIFPDPWPMKLISLLTFLITLFAYLIYFNDKNKLAIVWALLFLLWIPGYYFLTGNVIRQGLACSVVLLAIVLMLRQKYLIGFILCLTAVTIHNFSLFFIGAFIVCFLLRQRVWLLLIICPIIGMGVPWIATVIGLDLSHYVKYADYHEGSFHYIKFMASLILSGFFLFSNKWLKLKALDLRYLYISVAGLSALVLPFEVPYERLLLFSDFLIAMIATSLMITVASSRLVSAGLLLFYCLGLALWTNPSILVALGYYE